MANEKISGMASAAIVGTSDLVPIVQGGINKKATVSLLASAVNGNSNSALGLWIDPTSPSYNASGSNSTTTGSISASSNILTVASTSGWAAGMGIAVAGAGSGGTELVTSVAQVQATAMVLGTSAVTGVSNAVVNHDDTAALSAAMAASQSSGIPILLPNGNYNVSSALTPISSPMSFRGQDIFSTTIINRSQTANLFTINYSTLSSSSIINKACVIENFQVGQDPTVTSTDGFIFTVGASSGLTTGVRLRDIVFNGVRVGLQVINGQISNWFERLYFRNLTGLAIFYSSPAPNGDCHFHDIECTGYTTGIRINQSDTMEFSNLKTNFSGIQLGGSIASDIRRVRFINPSIEGDFVSTPGFGFDFGNGATQVSIIGGGFGGMPHAFNNLHLNSGGYVLTNVYNTSDSFSGWVQYGTVTTIAG